MRQLKTFIKNRRKEMLSCGDCQCETLQCRRDSDRNCGCGGEGGGGGPLTVTRDESYDGISLVVGENLRLGLTLSREANVNFRIDSGFYQIISVNPGANNHYYIDVLASTLGGNQGLVSDYLIVEDGEGNIISEVHLYLYVEVENISIDTTPITTYLGGYARIPFTYSPNNAYPILSMNTDKGYQSGTSSQDGSGYTGFYATAEGSGNITISAHGNDYNIDVTVLPSVQTINMDTSDMYIDLDNQPTVTRAFSYTPIDCDFRSISILFDQSNILSGSVVKTNNGEGYIELTGKNTGDCWVNLVNPYGQILSSFLVTTTSVLPDVESIDGYPSAIDLTHGDSDSISFNYYPSNARIESLSLDNSAPSRYSLELVNDGDGVGHIDIVSLETAPAQYSGGFRIYTRNGGEYHIDVNGYPSTEDQIINRFDSTSVFQSLSTEAQEEANEKAREIIEEAGDDIMPFYEAMQEGRTFAYYAEQMGLTPDTSGDCGSSVYTDDEAFIIYIGTAGAVSCEYLALVARRGLTPHTELINKQMISDYLDWVTEEGETCTYQFKDWDGEILKFGSVNVGGIPEAPDNPERSGYVFTGWDPEIQQISEDVIFTAQYTEEPSVTPLALESADNNNTISFQAYNNPDTTIPLDYNINGTGWQPVNWSNPQWTLNLSDTIMFRSRSTETTGFNFMSDDREQTQNYWVLTSNGPWRCSGDITTLINKNGTDTLTTNNVFANLFGRMPHLLSAPTLPAINLTEGCYAGMFAGCGDLVELPTLPATTLPNRCYSSMFSMCWGIRLSETETGEYQYPFRIPASGEGTSTSSSTRNMLSETGGTYNPYHTSTPINTTYYCANSKFIWGTYYLQALDTENLIVGELNGPHFQIICHTDEDWVDVVSSSGEMALQNLGTYCRGGSWRDKGTQWVVQEITKIYNLQQQHGVPNLEMRDDIFDAMVDFCIYNPYDKTGNNEYLMYLQGLVAQGDWYKTYPEENLR